MLVIYIFATVIIFYALNAVLSLFSIYLVNGDFETLYLLLSIIIGILLYISSVLKKYISRSN